MTMLHTHHRVGRLRQAAFPGGKISGIVAALIIVGVVVQPFLPKPLQTALIVTRLLAIPAILAACVLNLNQQCVLFGIAVITVAMELWHHTPFEGEELQVTLTLISALPYICAGLMAASRGAGKPIWVGVLVACAAINLATIVVYMNSIVGGSWASEIFVYVQRDGEDPLYRFALGNAIEIPSLLALATVAGALAVRERQALIGVALTANLIAALISQSRMVLIISCIAVLRCWRRFSRLGKAVTVIAVIAVLAHQSTDILVMMTSIAHRFGGEDANSAADRWTRFVAVMTHVNTSCFTLGNGVYSSVQLMETLGLGYRSVEAAALQAFYEIGLPRCLISAAFVMWYLRWSRVRITIRLEFVAAMIQVLVLLPIMSLTPMYLFFVGALLIEQTFEKPAVNHRARSNQLCYANA